MAYPAEVWEEVRKLYEDGVPCAKIAPVYGMNRNSISEKAKMDGWKKSKPKTKQIQQIQQIQQKAEILTKAKHQLELDKLLAHTEVVLAQAKAYQEAFQKFLDPDTGKVKVDLSSFNFVEICKEWRTVTKEASLFAAPPVLREKYVEFEMLPAVQKLRKEEAQLEREFFK